MVCSCDPSKVKIKHCQGKEACVKLQENSSVVFARDVQKVRPIHVNTFILSSSFPSSKTAMEFSNGFSKHQLALEPPEENECFGSPLPTPTPKIWKGL